MGWFNKKEIKEVQVSKPGAEMSIREMADFLYEHSEELREAYTRADLELALDDRGWLTPGTRTFNELDATTRITFVNKSRLYWLRDPLAKQAVRLWTDYALGDGIQVKAEDDTVQATINKFCKHPKNRKVMSSQGQRKSSKKMLIDGEVFFALFDDPAAGKVIRRVDPIQITDFICDPDDDETVLCYKRVTVDAKTLFYLDWACDEDQKALAAQQKDPATKNAIKLEDGVVMYHAPFDDIAKRGNGLLSSVVDWTREHRKLMESRVAIVQALAKFAYKGQVKGGQSAINAIQAKIQSTYAVTGPATIERQPPNAPGGTWLQNDGIDLQPMPRVTGSGDAKGDSDNLKLMVCAGTGIMLHYFGDPSTGNLATATAMELPMLKQFASYQTLWKDVYRDVFSIVLDEDPSDDEEQEPIDIDLAPILEDDLQKLGTFISTAANVFPEIKIPQVVKVLMTSLGVNDIDAVMKAIEDKRAAIDAAPKPGIPAPGTVPPIGPGNTDEDADSDLNAGDAPPVAGPPRKKKPVTGQEALIEALNKVSRLMDFQEWPNSSGVDDHKSRVTKLG